MDLDNETLLIWKKECYRCSILRIIYKILLLYGYIGLKFSPELHPTNGTPNLIHLLWFGHELSLTWYLGRSLGFNTSTLSKRTSVWLLDSLFIMHHCHTTCITHHALCIMCAKLRRPQKWRWPKNEDNLKNWPSPPIFSPLPYPWKITWFFFHDFSPSPHDSHTTTDVKPEMIPGV